MFIILDIIFNRRHLEILSGTVAKLPPDLTYYISTFLFFSVTTNLITLITLNSVLKHISLIHSDAY